MDGRTDEELALELRGGSSGAAAVLFARHYRGVWRVAFAVVGRRVLADEVAQDAFVRLIERIDQFDGRRRLVPWLYGIAVHRSVDLLRRERRIAPAVSEEGLVEWEGGGEDAAFLARLASLSSDRRAVVVLRYGLDMAPEEIAAALGVAVGTVHSRLARALAQLREEARVRADGG
jgi:RNA polymerase sigma-70 factor (ECF subfamily)